MTPDPELIAETKAWLAKARTDLRAASHEFTADPPLVEDIVFHAQQAVEKCFKAFLAWNSVAFRKTHSLEELGEACLQLEPALRPLVDRAVPLTEYAWKYRYPGEEEAPSVEEAQEASAIAREVYDAITIRLPPKARP
jgi:HEPN domain-containing protein